MDKIKQLAKWKEIQKDLTVLEKYMLELPFSENPQIATASKHLISAGGKRIRPAFALAIAKIYQCPLDKLLPLLAALEIIHTSSLMHDDVIDGSDKRRGMPTINQLMGNKMAIYSGDYLVGVALDLVSKYNDKRIFDEITYTTLEMSKGELRQLDDLYRTEQNMRDYMYRIQRKTALLFSTSCVTGAYVSGALDKEANAAKKYGYNLGMAFQVIDDILDMVSDEKTLGKPVGSDLRSGNISLPAVYVINTSNRGKELEEMILAQPNDDETVRQMIQIIKDEGGIEFADEIATAYERKALDQLDFLPQNKDLETLYYIADYVTKRKY